MVPNENMSATSETFIIAKIAAIVTVINIAAVAFVGWASSASLLIFLYILTIVLSTSTVTLLVTVYLWRYFTNSNWEDKLTLPS